MAVPLAIKRMLRERKELEQPNPDYFVCFQNDNLLHFDAYILGPTDSLYNHKLVKVHFDLPDNYPLVPPTCKFIQHSTQGRIHPNLYVDGKICLSILGTWPGEPWAQAMKIDSILITIRSLLDQSPFRHEPHGRDDPTYNAYVQYATWEFLLLDYLSNERSPEMSLFLRRFMQHHGRSMLEELRQQSRRASHWERLRNRYDRHETLVDYLSLSARIQKLIPCADKDVAGESLIKSDPAIIERVALWFGAPPSQLSAVAAPTPKAIAESRQSVSSDRTIKISRVYNLTGNEDSQLLSHSQKRTHLMTASIETKPSNMTNSSLLARPVKRKREPEAPLRKKPIESEVIVID